MNELSFRLDASDVLPGLLCSAPIVCGSEVCGVICELGGRRPSPIGGTSLLPEDAGVNGGVCAVLPGL